MVPDPVNVSDYTDLRVPYLCSFAQLPTLIVEGGGHQCHGDFRDRTGTGLLPTCAGARSYRSPIIRGESGTTRSAGSEPAAARSARMARARHSSGNAHRWSRLPGSSCCSAARVVELGEVGGQGRVVELPAAGEPGVELAEGAGVGAAGIGADRGVDQAARGRARPAERGLGRGDLGE